MNDPQAFVVLLAKTEHFEIEVTARDADAAMVAAMNLYERHDAKPEIGFRFVARDAEVIDANPLSESTNESQAQ
jgi:hypothetical protein